MKAPRMGAGAVKKPELTGWIPASKPPVHPGVYEILMVFHSRMLQSTGFAYWSGSQWSVSGRTPSAAEAGKRYAGIRRVDKWRGLAADPAKASK